MIDLRLDINIFLFSSHVSLVQSFGSLMFLKTVDNEYLNKKNLKNEILEFCNSIFVCFTELTCNFLHFFSHWTKKTDPSSSSSSEHVESQSSEILHVPKRDISSPTDFFNHPIIIGGKRKKRFQSSLSSTVDTSKLLSAAVYDSSGTSSSLSSKTTTTTINKSLFVNNQNVDSSSSTSSSSSSSSIRETAYVCEDGQLELSCQHGKHIDVLRANFGRFSITLCNPSGFLDWSVNCASGNSILPILTKRFVTFNFNIYSFLLLFHFDFLE